MTVARTVPALVVLSTGVLAAPQERGGSGSETFTAVGSWLVSGGRRAESGSYVGESTLGFTLGGGSTASASFVAVEGVVAVPPELSASRPIVFGVIDPFGPAAGGVGARVVGAGFSAPGAGLPLVELGGATAPGVVVESDGTLGLQTPVGADAKGNPLAAVGVDVVDGNGQSSADAAFVYTPALVASAPASIGDTLALEFHGDPGDLHRLMVGASLPGISIPIAGIDGQFDLVAFFLFVTPPESTPTGFATYSIPIPESSSLIGKSLEWQGVRIQFPAPLTIEGSFTNRLTTEIQP